MREKRRRLQDRINKYSIYHCSIHIIIILVQQIHPQYTLLLLGIDNAGKSAIFNTLIGKPDPKLLPTVGLESHILELDSFKCELIDLGGGRNIRSYWTSYLARAHGIIYVVDVTDSERMKESSTVFDDLMKHSFMHEKPLLILKHKKDELGEEYDVIQTKESPKTVLIKDKGECEEFSFFSKIHPLSDYSSIYSPILLRKSLISLLKSIKKAGKPLQRKIDLDLQSEAERKKIEKEEKKKRIAERRKKRELERLAREKEKETESLPKDLPVPKSELQTVNTAE
ncbi:Small GTPase superfamily, ARF/SAR type like protein [Aduncisulcus paluster]|uniref:Small GTPase superfamily, ARF/SAR type like protein n=1 Tax=Aduncisulcus paluster TaxID=2918883 RepID=A0ABQ5KT58_9EUKA|nr:Small GTPase superfamily, ARF/SAR type like protein [Aduncisulcus paluster]